MQLQLKTNFGRTDQLENLKKLRLLNLFLQRMLANSGHVKSMLKKIDSFEMWCSKSAGKKNNKCKHDKLVTARISSKHLSQKIKTFRTHQQEQILEYDLLTVTVKGKTKGRSK